MRVTVKNTNEYPWFIQPFFWNQKKKYSVVLLPGLVWARVPKLFASVAILYGALDRKSSPLDPVLRSLITVRVSQINWRHFCVDIKASTLAKRDGSLAKAEQVGQWQKSELFSDKERVALEYTEAITFSDQQVTDELVVRLKGFVNFRLTLVVTVQVSHTTYSYQLVISLSHTT